VGVVRRLRLVVAGLAVVAVVMFTVGVLAETPAVVPTIERVR